MNRLRLKTTMVMLPILLLLFTVLIPAGAEADIGRNGGKVALKSDLELMSGVPVHGGGHFTWTISGPAAGELRQAIILNYDVPRGSSPRNWQLEQDEVEQYALVLERYLEDETLEHTYMGANLRRFALLNRRVQDDTKGLIGTSNSSTGAITLRFYFDAWMPSGETTVKLTDTRMLDAVFHPVNETFHGTYSIEHTEYMVSVGDFAEMDISEGNFYLIRTPFGDIFHYSITFEANNNPNEKLLYEPFNWIECPLVLFIMIIVLGYFVATMPGRYRKYDVMKIVKVHTFAKVLLLIMILLYLIAGIGGMFIAGVYLWVISMIFLFVSMVISKTVYEKASRVTRLPEKPEVEPAPVAAAPMEEEEVPETDERTVQCATCGEIFSLKENFAVSSAPCPACGSIGAVEFGKEEMPPPPPPEPTSITPEEDFLKDLEEEP
jgi:hypothetical protein